MAVQPVSVFTSATELALAACQRRIQELPVCVPTAQDPSRGARMILVAVGLTLDDSKNRITGDTIGPLMALAKQAAL
jgi:hypothetical protein